MSDDKEKADDVMAQLEQGLRERAAKSGRKLISEKDGVHNEWYTEARKQTLATLPAFLSKITGEYEHDYGTVCHMIAASAIAAATAANKSEGGRGGIAGFQAGVVMWQFAREWLHVNGPMKIVRYEDMLYPQYKQHFDKILDKYTWEQIQECARVQLAEMDGRGHPDVRAHMEAIIAGVVPFGYRVE